MRHRLIRWASGPLSGTAPMPRRPGGVAMATIVSDVENIGTAESGSSARGDQDSLRKSVTDAFRRGPWNLGNREMHDASLVRIERSELLVESSLLRLLGQEYRHPPQLHVLAFPIFKSIDEDALFTRQSSTVGSVDDVLKGLERLAAPPHKDFRLVAADIQAGAVRGALDGNFRLYAQRSRELLQELGDRTGDVVGHDRLTAPARQPQSCLRPRASCVAPREVERSER